MTHANRSPRTLRLLMAAAALALPSIALAQGQVDMSRGNEASNRIGSGGRNGSGVTPSSANYLINNGNRIVTGNVTLGREFHGNVGYTDPSAFRGTTAGALSDRFTKNSSGVPQSYAPPPPVNQSTSFFGASQTVQPPPGTELTANRAGYMPAPPPGQRDFQDKRLGIVNVNVPISNVPIPGEMLARGSLNPSAQQPGILSASPLYGVREWNPNDPADREFLENMISRQAGDFSRIQQDPREVKRMQEELQKALNGDQPQQQADPNAHTQGAITQQPIGLTLESTPPSSLPNKPLSDQVPARPVGADVNTDQSIRYNLVSHARRTSTQYTELSKRLEQFYADRPKTDTDFARQFNAELKAKTDADAKATAAAKAKAAANDPLAGGNTPAKPDAADPTKPKVKKPTPVKVPTLVTGVRGEGLANVMKKAEALMKEGKFTSALDQYDTAETVTPNNPLIWLGRANAELGAGFYTRAEDHLRQALTADKALLMGQYDLTGMIGEDRLAKLVTELKDIANKDATKASPVFLLAYIAYNTGHERQALGYLDLAEKRGGDQSGFYKALRDHWALPEGEGKTDPAKPEQNK